MQDEQRDTETKNRTHIFLDPFVDNMFVERIFRLCRSKFQAESLWNETTDQFYLIRRK